MTIAVSPLVGWWAAAVGTLVVLAGCATEPPLRNAQPSAAAVAERILDALASGDRAALASLALDEAEFRAHVWPSLPASRPERNLPFSYVWGDLRQKSEAGLRQTLAKYQGRHFELREVAFAAAPDRYADFVVHRNAVLRVRGAGGEDEIRVCGSLFERDGRWKVFSYVVDD
jgi:hypothetical protein